MMPGPRCEFHGSAACRASAGYPARHLEGPAGRVTLDSPLGRRTDSGRLTRGIAPQGTNVAGNPHACASPFARPLPEHLTSTNALMGISMNLPRLKISHPRTRSMRPIRRRFGLEPLECRYLPSAGLPGITSTLPADGSVMIQPPQSFTINLDPSVLGQVDAVVSPIFGIAPDAALSTIVALDANVEIEIDQVGPGGSTTPYLGGSSLWPVDETVDTTTAADGSTQNQLVVSLPAGSPAMLPGTYQISVLPSSFLAQAYALVEPDSAWANSTAPIPIGQFTVLARAATFAGATNLGTIGPATQTVSGIIEPSVEQSAVQLYQFSVPTGGQWNFNAQLDSTSIDSRLQSVLTLFDARGDVLATTGGVDDSIDPDLTASLASGTYFIGVSGAGNVPGIPGGYDPITGMPGTGGLSAPGGPFVLDLTATPVVRSTSLVDFQLDHADVLETAPTGLDLTFSGAVDVDSLASPDHRVTALSVVDSWGRTWPISYMDPDDQSSQDSLSFLFDEPLPPGNYSLVVPTQGGLTDLAGNPVVGPAGSSPGVLATWTVAAPTGPADPENLGVIWPGSINVTWSTPVTGSDTLAAGQEVDDRFVVICPGIYEVQAQVGAGSVDVHIVNSEGQIVRDSGSLPSLYATLVPGAYRLLLVSTSSSTTEIDWTLVPNSLDWDKNYYNGVGQVNALVLPMTGPFPETAGPTAATAGSDGSATPIVPPAATSAGATSGNASSNASELGGSPLQTALLVSMETGLAGLPSTNSGSIPSVGTMAAAITIPTNDAGRGLAQGLPSWNSSGTDLKVGEDDPADAQGAVPPAPAERVGSAQTDGMAAPEAASARADAIALARADRLVRIAGWFSDKIDVTPTGLLGTGLPAAELGSTGLAAAATDAPAFPPATTDFWSARRQRIFREVAQGDIGVPCTLLVATALTYRFSLPIRKWWRRHDPAHFEWPRPFMYRGGPRTPSTRPIGVIDEST
jgi:hypothetical protein